MPDIVRQPGARLSGQVDPRLAKRFYPGPLANLRRSYGAFHAFDKTHTVALVEAGLILRMPRARSSRGCARWKPMVSKRFAIEWAADGTRAKPI
jgi:hypothetical protein